MNNACDPLTPLVQAPDQSDGIASGSTGAAPDESAPPLPDHLLKSILRRSVFSRPIYLERSAWKEHIPFAFWITEAHRPSSIVELGTHFGGSYFAFCQTVERLGLDTRCFAIDTWEGDDHAGTYENDVYKKVNAHNIIYYSRFSRLIQSTFDDAAPHFSDGFIDLLHIDGLHTFDAVRHDFENWLPKLSRRGIVILHDSNVRERDFGVFRLAEDLRNDYPTFDFVHGHGLTIVAIGPEQNQALTQFFDAAKDPRSKQFIQEIFALLGRGCSDSFIAYRNSAAMKAAHREANDAKTRSDMLSAKVEKKNDLIACHLNDLKIEREAAKALRAELDAGHTRTRTLEAKLETERTTTAELRAKLKAERERRLDRRLKKLLLQGQRWGRA
ncbi:MAG: class I SAM-dependent methyltransferase [Pseudomonadota bacterium]